jgi:hypothetical protein
LQISPKNRQTKKPLDGQITVALLNKGEIMEFAIVFIDSDDSEKSASIKAISEHKAVELFAHIYGDFEIVEVSEM